MGKPRKPKICKVCKGEFMPFMTTQKVCDFKCALELVEIDKVRAFKRETVRMKAAIKPRAKWMKEAQAAFNKFIRLRDAGEPCISCGKPNDGSHQRHASHYRSVKACSALRFNTWNVHASCMQCNAILSGNLIEYRIRLIKKLGADRIDWLESQNQVTRYDIDYLKRIKKVFALRAKML